MDVFLLAGVLLGGFLWGRAYEASAQAKKRRRQQYLALPHEEKLVAKIEENIDLREIQRLLDLSPLDVARASDGITPVIATMRYVGGNYQNHSRRYRILLEIARRLPNEQVVPALNARDKKGWTALMHAAAQSDALGGALLIHLGADPTLKNHNGQTAADISAKWPSVVPIFEGRDVPPSFPKLLTSAEGKWP